MLTLPVVRLLLGLQTHEGDMRLVSVYVPTNHVYVGEWRLQGLQQCRLGLLQSLSATWVTRLQGAHACCHQATTCKCLDCKLDEHPAGCCRAASGLQKTHHGCSRT